MLYVFTSLSVEFIRKQAFICNIQTAPSFLATKAKEKRVSILDNWIVLLTALTSKVDDAARVAKLVVVPAYKLRKKIWVFGE